jgi:hypothetical protein
MDQRGRGEEGVSRNQILNLAYDIYAVSLCQSQMQGLNVNSEMPIPSVQGILNHSILMMMAKVRQGVHFEIAVAVAKKRLPSVSPKSDILESLEHS